jgi:hypothetical protein
MGGDQRETDRSERCAGGPERGEVLRVAHFHVRSPAGAEWDDRPMRNQAAF